MQYEVTTSTLNVEISDKSSLAVGANINLIKAGELEVEEAVKKGIEIFNDNAAIKQAEVNAAVSEARDWAIKIDGKVDDDDYSSKYYAQQAADLMNDGVIATGGTTKRSLQDHFGDILNVKDFGAKGDGVTDDTAAFESALLKNKTIYVPCGSYKLNKQLYGKFITDNKLTFTNKKIYVENIGYIGNDLRKDIFSVFDYEFPGYSNCVSALGVDITAVACAFAINSETKERFIFVGYKVKSGIGMAISCYNLTTDSFVGYNYSTTTMISEGMVVKYNSGFDVYINPMTEQRIYKATFLGNGSEITFSQYSSFENENKMAYRNGTWLLRTLRKNTSDKKFNMVLTDDSFNVISQITMPLYEYDLLSDYSSPDLIQHKIPHKQGIGLLDNSWCFFAGGSSSGIYNNGEENNGVIEYSFEGDFIRSSICNTNEYINVLNNVSGKTITWLENEGGFIDDCNRIVSMNCVKLSNNSRKLYFIEEFSKSATSFDCSGIFDTAHYGNVLNKLSSVSFPYFYGNKLKNPLTNENFDTIDDVAQFMIKANISYLKITDALTYGLYSACGINIIDPLSTSKFYTIELTNKDGSSVNVDITTANQNHIQDKEISKRSYVIYNLGSTPTLNLESNMVNSLYVMGSSTREDSASLNEKPTIEFNGGSEAIISWETYRDRENKYALMRFIDNGTRCFWDIGYSALYKSPQEIRMGVHSTYGAKNKNAGLVIKSDSAYPAANSVMSLGIPSMRWTEVFADTATINTSDERMKQDIEDIDERVFRAWEKVDFKQFRFKEAVNKKGENARIHFGIIAQQVKEAFESEGLDGFKYGLLCYDEWDDEYEDIEVTDKPAEYDEAGNVIAPAEVHTEKRLVRAAGNAYGIRYGEALALECAYQRWKLEQRLA